MRCPASPFNVYRSPARMPRPTLRRHGDMTRVVRCPDTPSTCFITQHDPRHQPQARRAGCPIEIMVTRDPPLDMQEHDVRRDALVGDQSERGENAALESQLVTPDVLEHDLIAGVSGSCLVHWHLCRKRSAVACMSSAFHACCHPCTIPLGSRCPIRVLSPGRRRKFDSICLRLAGNCHLTPFVVRIRLRDRKDPKSSLRYRAPVSAPGQPTEARNRSD